MFRTLRWTVLALALPLMTAAAALAAPTVQVRPALAVSEDGGLLTAAREWLLARLRPFAPSPAGKKPVDQQRKGGCSADPDGHQACR
jgi:hypothetical protein